MTVTSKAADWPLFQKANTRVMYPDSLFFPCCDQASCAYIRDSRSLRAASNHMHTSATLAAAEAVIH